MNTALFDELFDLSRAPYTSPWIREIDRNIMICLMNSISAPCFTIQFYGPDKSLYVTVYTSNFQFRYFCCIKGFYTSIRLTTIHIPYHLLYFLKLSTPGPRDTMLDEYRGVDLRKEKDETHPEWFLSSGEKESKRQVVSIQHELLETQETLARTLRGMDEMRTKNRRLEMENNVLTTQVETRNEAIQRMELENRQLNIKKEELILLNQMLSFDQKVLQDSLKWIKDVIRN